MISKPLPMCGTHKVQKEWSTTTFEYSHEGLLIRVPNVYAWVCPKDGEASFTPETVDELSEAVRELHETAKRIKKRCSRPTEYIIVSAAE